MIKSLIAPIQGWLMSKGQCPGCGRPLAKGFRESHSEKGQEKVTCRCGRIFIHNSAQNRYRRALFDEI